MNNQLTTNTQKASIASYLSNSITKQNIASVVGEQNITKFITSIVSAVQTNPALQKCTNKSILSAALLGQSLNLSPSPQLGQFYLVPYENKKIGMQEAQFQMGYKGYIQLAIRSGQYKKLSVVDIKEGELVKYDPLNEEIEVKLMEDEEEREKAITTGYYAMFEYLNGFHKSIYWSKKKMIAHADKYSKAFSANASKVYANGQWLEKVSYEDYVAGNYPKGSEWLYSSFWYKDFDGMAFKTMLRQLISKWGIMSIEMQTAYDSDMAVIDDSGNTKYVDSTIAPDEITNPFLDKPDSTVIEVIPEEKPVEKKKVGRPPKNAVEQVKAEKNEVIEEVGNNESTVEN